MRNPFCDRPPPHFVVCVGRDLQQERIVLDEAKQAAASPKRQQCRTSHQYYLRHLWEMVQTRDRQRDGENEFNRQGWPMLLLALQGTLLIASRRRCDGYGISGTAYWHRQCVSWRC